MWLRRFLYLSLVEEIHDTADLLLDLAFVVLHFDVGNGLEGFLALADAVAIRSPGDERHSVSVRIELLGTLFAPPLLYLLFDHLIGGLTPPIGRYHGVRHNLLNRFHG